MTIKLNRRQTLIGMGLATLPACAHTIPKPFDAQIIVLGAGIAGLNAARILANEGLDVLVLEANNRIGGRLHTLDTGDERYSEAGGEQIGAGYARVRHTAKELGINISNYKSGPSATLLNYQGENLNTEEWASTPGNPFPDALKAIAPGSLLGRLAFKENPLKDIYSWSNSNIGDVSAYDWLRAKGLDEDALNLADHTLNANDLKSYSMLNMFRSLALFSQDSRLGKSGYIEGGAQRLPEAMANDLPGEVKLNQRVTAISSSESGVRVDTDGGTYYAENVISALPFPALSRIAITAPLSAIQKSAIKNLPYTQILQIHFRSGDAFWEQDQLPASMWTDGPLERLFARSDDDGSPDGFFRSWVNGIGATQLNKLSDSEISKLCSTELKRLRPASKGDLDVLKVVRWTSDNALAGGAYMHWAPGQISEWQKTMGQAAGRLFFAGEHLSKIHTGLEGAMESGENTAFEILSL